MKKIAVLIHRKNKQFDLALSICKENNLYLDAIQTVRECNNSDLAINLIEFFLKENM